MNLWNPELQDAQLVDSGDPGPMEAPPAGADLFGYTNGSLLTPWTKTYQGGGVSYAAPEYKRFAYDDFAFDGFKPMGDYAVGPDFGERFEAGGYAAPTAEQVQQEPGYAFGFTEGQRAITANRAAKGLLRTGGAAKELTRYGQDYAGTRYNEAYGRGLATFQANEGARQGAFDRRFGVHQANEGNRLAGWQANAGNRLAGGQLGYEIAGGTYDRNIGKARMIWGDDANHAQAVASAANSSAASAEGARRDAYEEEKRNFLGNQDTQFGRLMALANMGQGSAGAVGAYGAGYGANAGNLYTGAANAEAAGRVGSANAWTGALGNIGNTVAELGAYYGTQPRAGAAGGGRGRGGYGGPDVYSGVPRSGYPQG